MAIKCRHAEKADSGILAELISIASDGVVDYLFHELVPNTTPVQIMAYNLEQDNHPHFCKSAMVAEDKTNVAGLALSYPSWYHEIRDEMRCFFPNERVRYALFYTGFRMSVKKNLGGGYF